jgi:hypothetical protein
MALADGVCGTNLQADFKQFRKIAARLHFSSSAYVAAA